MSSERKILIIYPYFVPATRAGGVVSSLNHLVGNLPHFNFDVLTSAYDLDGTPLQVTTDEWIQFSINCRVWYQSSNGSFNIVNQVADNQYTSIYLNGIYGKKYFLQPLWHLRKWKKTDDHQLIIAPRGMVQEGSLQIKWLKKKLYLSVLKASGLLNHVCWHATDEQELTDIKKIFHPKKIIKAIDSPPLSPIFPAIQSSKQQGELHAVFLSLITQKKNLLFLLNLLDRNSQLNIQLDIYGPIKDHTYWEECLTIINRHQSRICYKGEVAPNKVSETLAHYDLFVLPTLGENFGHAIFEALVAGKPVLITPYTPWQNLYENACGATPELEEKHWVETIAQYISMNHNTHTEQCYNAQQYVKSFLRNMNFIEEYEKLFSH